MQTSWAHLVVVLAAAFGLAGCAQTVDDVFEAPEGWEVVHESVDREPLELAQSGHQTIWDTNAGELSAATTAVVEALQAQGYVVEGVTGGSSDSERQVRAARDEVGLRLQLIVSRGQLGVEVGDVLVSATRPLGR